MVYFQIKTELHSHLIPETSLEKVYEYTDEGGLVTIIYFNVDGKRVGYEIYETIDYIRNELPENKVVQLTEKAD